MVDAVIHVVVERLLAIGVERIQDEVDLVLNSDKEAETLASTLQLIKDVLDDAEKKSVTDPLVKAWLEKIEEVSYEMDDALDQLQIMRLGQEIEATPPVSGFWNKVTSFLHSICLCPKHVFGSRSIALKIKELNGRLESVAKENDNQFNLLRNVSGHVAKPRNSQEFKRFIATSYVEVSKVKGRDDDRNNLVHKLLSLGGNHLEMFSIVGVGGLGKTTLAQLVFNDSRVKEHFHTTTWISVSDPFDEIIMAKEILESLELQRKPTTLTGAPERSSGNLTGFQQILERIERSILNKRFLLVLDDVWKHDVEHQWEPLKVCLSKGAPGSRILVTTRNKGVAEMMGTTEIYPLRLLSDPECFALLSQASRLEAKENHTTILEKIGKEIAKRCDGLPLAAKTLGGLLCQQDTPREWEDVLKSEIWQMKIVEEKLFPHLYLSYNALSPAVKRCFSYCALISKDSEIEVDMLIRMWMAQGFLSGGNPRQMEQVGLQYFQDLASGSFFQDIENKGKLPDIPDLRCRMHNIIHNFAQFLTKNKCVIVDSVAKIGKEVRHLSLLVDHKPEASTHASMGGSLEKLRSFLCEGDLPPRMLSTLKSVRVLILYRRSWQELPPMIGDLIHLRYLSLQNNINLRQLPGQLGNLYNMQTLDIRGCLHLSKLPEEIYKLVNLRHLLLSEYISIPQGLGKLTCLRTLKHFDARKCKLGYLKNLNQLEGVLYIIIGASNEESDGTKEENAELKNKKLIYLDLNFRGNYMRSFREEAFEPPPDVLHLRLNRYVGNQFPRWISTSLHNLKSLEISSSDFRNSPTLPPLGNLQSLETLRISVHKDMKYLGREFLGMTENNTGEESQVAFPKLKILDISSCDNWTEWQDITEEEENTVRIMQCLRELRVWGCPKLKALPCRLLIMMPLETLDISVSFLLNEQYWSGELDQVLNPTCRIFM